MCGLVHFNGSLCAPNSELLWNNFFYHQKPRPIIVICFLYSPLLAGCSIFADCLFLLSFNSIKASCLKEKKGPGEVYK